MLDKYPLQKLKKVKVTVNKILFFVNQQIFVKHKNVPVQKLIYYKII
jgi:hypothetical protein